MALLMDRQLAEAHVRAAERQLNRAQQRLERMRGALPLSPNEKRQRTVVADHPRVAQGGENPPNWEHFAGYSRETYHRAWRRACSLAPGPLFSSPPQLPYK